MLLALAGCYAAPPGQNDGYALPGYAPGYPPAPPPSYDPYAGGFPGYNDNNGPPTYFDGGVAVPLVLLGGEWGYYDRDRYWRRAPERVARDLDAHTANGDQFHSGATQPSPQSRPGQPAGHAEYRPAVSPRSLPAPVAAAPQRHDERDRHRACPAGQHC